MGTFHAIYLHSKGLEYVIVKLLLISATYIDW